MNEVVLGLSLGFAAGVSPGPLLVLVITATLRSGWRAGALAACAPLVTDLVIVASVLLVLERLPARAVSVLGVVGGVVVALVGVQTTRDARGAALGPTAARAVPRRTLSQASLVNITSPHPWITWASALGPLTVATYERGSGGAVALVGAFYLALVGTKVGIAVLVGGARQWLDVRGYRIALGLSGLMLVAFGVVLVIQFLPQA